MLFSDKVKGVLEVVRLEPLTAWCVCALEVLLLYSALCTISVASFSLGPMLISLPIDDWLIGADSADHSSMVWWEGGEGLEPQGV